MSATIWKFKLDINDEQVVEMPAGARVLSAGMMPGAAVRSDEPHIWALVQPGRPKKPMTVFVRGTGHPADDVLFAAQFIGTIFYRHGPGAVVVDPPLVFHVFAGKQEE